MKLEHLDGDTQAAVQLAEGMDSHQCDDWYEANVGYRLLDDEPGLPLDHQRAAVAGMAYLQQLPEGADTKGAEAQIAGIDAYFGVTPK